MSDTIYGLNRLIKDQRLTPKQEKQIRGLIRGDIEPDDFDSVSAWLFQCHNRPSDTELIMKAINEVLETHGVEAIWNPDFSEKWPQFTYCNTGDTYVLTVCYDYFERKFIVTSCGDLVEKNSL